jgi:hypothetical protein
LTEPPSHSYSSHTNPPGGLANYYRNNVIGGAGAFVAVAENFNSFEQSSAPNPPRRGRAGDLPGLGARHDHLSGLPLLAKWETVSGRFGGYLTAPWNLSLADVLPKWSPHCMPPP